MKKIVFLSLVLLACGLSVYATHNRAGEITYRALDSSCLYYEITITTYTKTSSLAADRPQLDSVHLDPNTVDTVPRFDQLILPNDVKRNRYIVNHLYPGPGVYKIWFADPNRVDNIVNMTNSIDIPFYLETILVISPFETCNSSPVLNYPPIDRGCVNKLFIHNPIAIDPDGDSLSYQLTVPMMAPTTPVPGYFLPANVTLDSITGDLVWNTPQAAGEYNIAFYIIEWRNGSPIDSVERDMQITILNCNNNPPQITTINDTCIFAGDTLSFTVTATDPDGGQLITLTKYGSVFTVVDPATFSSNSPNEPVVGNFNWNTQCHHIRLQPYTAVFRAQDNSNEVQLVDLENVNIRVIAPPPQNLTATPTGNSIVLNWNPGICATDKGYRIWRRSGMFTGTFNCPCETGVPVSTGFSLIGTVLGNNNTTFTDFTQLALGIQYCYVVTIVFADGSESCPSNQACALLKQDLPVIINASVNTTSTTNGSVFVRWRRPLLADFDSVQYPPPYQYRLYHYPAFTAPNPDTLITTLFNISDTTYVDTFLNTVAHPYSYRVEFYYDSSGVPTYLGETQRASTVYLSIASTDEQLNLSWQETVPWTNHFYEVFRYNNVTTNWDSIGRAFTQTFSDTNLINDTLYCYYVKSVGTYSAPGFDTTWNNSQEKCERPYDNVPPCAPHLTVAPDCIANANSLTWNNPNNSCADDVIGYYIYYRPAEVNDYVLLDSLLNATDTTFVHSGLQSIAGCYYVTAFDSNRNESTDFVPICVDTCYQYYLPNVFSPDGSGLNDFLHPCDWTTAAEMQVKCPPYQNVKDVDIKFFNRWGEVVFETTNRDINWNGKHKDNGKDCPEGVYFYTGIVNFISLSGDISKDLHGFVHLIRKK